GLGLGLAVLFLVSCARPAIDNKVATTSDTATEAPAAAKSSGVIVTGARVAAPPAVLYEPRAADMVAAGPPPPPPPPPAPGMQSGWSPPYHDVGRDKFTSVAENPFKIVQEA